MRLLALVGDAFGGRGGIACYNRDLLTSLAVHGRAQVTIVPREGDADLATLPPGVHQQKPRGRIGFVAVVLWIAWRAGPFDAIFCGHLHLAPVAAAVGRLFRLPLWLQLHGQEAWGPLSSARRRAAEGAALITIVSRYTRHRFLGLARVEPWRVRVLPNTFASRFSPGPKPEYLIDRHGLRSKTVLLTVGRLNATERGKGHDRVIAVLPTLAASRRDILYLIVGTGSDQVRLEALARELGVAERVVFAGAVGSDELPDYYRSADLFVMPSVQEGFGIVLLEAAASGLRVVAGNTDGSADALADGRLGRLVDPFDQDALVDAIEQMLAAGSPDAALVDRYSFARFAEQASQLFDEVLASNQAAGERRAFLEAG